MSLSISTTRKTELIGKLTSHGDYIVRDPTVDYDCFWGCISNDLDDYLDDKFHPVRHIVGEIAEDSTFYGPNPDWLEIAYQMRIHDLIAQGCTYNSAVVSLSNLVLSARASLRAKKRCGFLINKRNHMRQRDNNSHKILNAVCGYGNTSYVNGKKDFRYTMKTFLRSCRRFGSRVGICGGHNRDERYGHLGLDLQSSTVIDYIDNCTPIGVFLYSIFRSRNVTDVGVAFIGFQHSLRKQYPDFVEYINDYIASCGEVLMDWAIKVFTEYVKVKDSQSDIELQSDSSDNWYTALLRMTKLNITPFSYLIFAILGLYQALSCGTFPHINDLSKSSFSSAMDVASSFKNYVTTLECLKHVFNSLTSFLDGVFFKRVHDTYLDNPFASAISLGSDLVTSQPASMLTGPGELAVIGKKVDDYLRIYSVCKYNKDSKNPFKMGFSYSWPDVERQHYKVMQYINDYNKIMKSSSVRQAPFTFMLFGGTSLGKSTLMTSIIRCLSFWGNLPLDDKFTYYFSPGLKHMDGYMPWKTAVVLDDAGAVRRDFLPEGDPMVTTMLRMANNVPFQTPQAELADKKCTPFMSQILGISTNVPDINASTYMNFGAVIERRIKYRFRVKVADEYAVNGTLSQDVASAAVNAHPNGIPPLWTITVEEYRAHNVNEGSGVRISGNWHIVNNSEGLKLEDIDTYTFMRWLRHVYIQHIKIQNQVVRFANEPFKFCKVCELPSGVCRCDYCDVDTVNDNRWTTTHINSYADSEDTFRSDALSWYEYIRENFFSQKPIHSPLEGNKIEVNFDDDNNEDLVYQSDVVISYDLKQNFLLIILLLIFIRICNLSFVVLCGCCLYFILPKVGIIGSVGNTAFSVNYASVLYAVILHIHSEVKLYMSNKIMPVVEWASGTTVNCVKSFVYSEAVKQLKKHISDRSKSLFAFVAAASLFVASCIAMRARIKVKAVRDTTNSLGDESFDAVVSGLANTSSYNTIFHGNTVTTATIPPQPKTWDDQVSARVYDAKNTFLSVASKCSNGASSVAALQCIHESLATAMITFKIGGISKSVYCKATVLGGGYVLLNSHSVREAMSCPDLQLNLIMSSCGGSDIRTMGHKRVSRGWTGHVSSRNCYIPKGPDGVDMDLALIYVHSLNMNGCGKYLTNDYSYSVHSDPAILSRSETGELAPINNISIISRSENVTVQYGDYSIRHSGLIHYTSRYSTNKGDSGSLIVVHLGDFDKSVHRQISIIGIHVGVSGASGYGIGTLLTQQLLDKWKYDMANNRISLESDVYESVSFIASGVIYNGPFKLDQELVSTHIKSCVSRTTVDIVDEKFDHVETKLPMFTTVYGGLRQGNNFKQGTRSNFKLTPWSDMLSHIVCPPLCAGLCVNKYSPAVVEPRRLWEVHTRAYISSVGSVEIGVPESICDIAAAQYLREFIHQVDATNGNWNLVRPFGIFEAINGVPGLFKKINFTTGSGFGYDGKKFKHFVDVPPVFAGDICVYSNPKMPSPELQVDIDEMESMLSRGEDPCSVFEAHVKDEVRSKDKIISAKLRVMNGSQLPYTILMRQYLMGIVLIMAFHKYKSECMVGMNVESVQWTHFANWLKDYGGLDRFLDGDYVDFDKNQKSVISGAASKVIIGVIKYARKNGLWTDVQYSRACTLVISLQACCVNFFGTIVKFLGINPSGHSLTTQKNCIVNSIYMRCVFYVLAQEHDSQLLRDNLWFIHNVRQCTYGDDVVMAVRESCPWFNHRTIQKVLAGWGCPYTRADKSEITDANKYTSFTDLVFLKRSWHWDDESNMYLAKIDGDAIIKMLHYFEVSDCLSYRESHINLLRSANELAFTYGRDNYTIIFSMLCELARFIDGESEFLNGSSTSNMGKLPNFDDYIIRLKNNSIIDQPDDNIEFGQIGELELQSDTVVSISDATIFKYADRLFQYDPNFDSNGGFLDSLLFATLYQNLVWLDLTHDYFRSGHWCYEFASYIYVNYYDMGIINNIDWLHAMLRFHLELTDEVNLHHGM